MARRRYRNPEHQRQYDYWRNAKPSPETFDILNKSWDGCAYTRGYRWPNKEQYRPGSLARIAWAAGVDNRRDAERLNSSAKPEKHNASE